MDFTVTVLGTGAAIPTLNRGNSAHFIKCQQREILIDCGEGTQLQMRKYKVKFQNIQLILISHLHGDHIFGLPGLIGTMQLLGRTSPLKIIGPKGIKEYLLTTLRLIGLPLKIEIEFIEKEHKEGEEIVFEDKCIQVTSFPLNHRISTYGYKISEKPGKRRLDKEAFDKTGVSISYISKLLDGEDITDNKGTTVLSKDVTYSPKPTKSYAYCSDTAYYEPLIPIIENVDLLYHEATFLETERKRADQTYHSTAREAAKIAAFAGVKRLILGHFSNRYKTDDDHLEEARNYFTNSFTAKDGELFIV